MTNFRGIMQKNKIGGYIHENILLYNQKLESPIRNADALIIRSKEVKQVKGGSIEEMHRDLYNPLIKDIVNIFDKDAELDSESLQKMNAFLE